MHDVNERFAVLEETEKSALRNLLVEERSRICFFANCLSPVLVGNEYGTCFLLIYLSSCYLSKRSKLGIP